MSAHPATSQHTILCLWCNGVLEWGAGGIDYDLCERCVPSVMQTLSARLAEIDFDVDVEPGFDLEHARERQQPAWKRLFAAH